MTFNSYFFMPEHFTLQPYTLCAVQMSSSLVLFSLCLLNQLFQGHLKCLSASVKASDPAG